MTTRARRELYAKGVLQIVRTMRTPGLPAGHTSMTFPTVDRVEPALVPAVVGADVAIQAFRVAVNTAREVRRIDVVALATEVGLPGRLQHERQEAEEHDEGSHEQDLSGSRTASCK